MFSRPARRPALSAAELLTAVDALAVVLTDPDGLVTDVTASAAHLLGIGPGEGAGRPVLDLLPVLQRPSGDGGRRSCSLHGAGDATVEVRTTAVSTGFVHVLSVLTDVQAELDEARRAHALDRLLVDHLPAAVVGVLDPDLRWLALGGERLTGVGHDPDSTVGHVVGEGLDAHTAADIRAFYRAAMIEPVHRTVARDDGRWLEVDAQPVTGPDGTTLVLSLSRDVTARRAAELSAQAAAEALTRSEARFRTAFDSAPIGMLLVSASKATFGRCVGVNAAFARMVGRPARDLVGSPLTQLVDPSAPALLLSPNLATGDDRRATTSLQHASGATTPVELVYSLSTDASGAPLFVVQVEDITARRATEVALLDALEQQHAAEHALREADRVRTDVVSTVSHELRTPLTALGASLHLLAEGDAGPVSAQQLELLAIAQRNATRLERLIDNLLLLTTLDRTIDADGDETVDLVETVRRAADLVVPAMTRREQHLELDLPSAAVVVAGDDMQLCFAMVKLLANAAQFSDTGGRVVVRLTQDADGVAVTVSDDGVGIPDDEREQIFDRFFRGAHAQSLGLPGTGLGLSIAQSVARRHGGRITVESTAGVGSTFRMRLPRRPAVPTGRPGTDRAVTPAVGVPHVA